MIPAGSDTKDGPKKKSREEKVEDFRHNFCKPFMNPSVSPASHASSICKSIYRIPFFHFLEANDLLTWKQMFSKLSILNQMGFRASQNKIHKFIEVVPFSQLPRN